MLPADRSGPAAGERGAARPRVSRATKAVWDILESIADPEIPVIDIVELGIVRSVDLLDDGTIEVAVTTTYSGCPATEVIRAQISATLNEHGYTRHRLREVLSPPWTSDWITPTGRAKLEAYGIAPPPIAVSNPRQLATRVPVACPRCKSENTETISEFGSTPCKALKRCRSCREPFELFKCI